MSESPLLIEISQGSATLSLNRPKSLNALSSELRRMLIDQLAALDSDPDVRVVILTGTGRAFCAGIDLKEIGRSGENVNSNVDAENVVEAMVRFSKPLIGAINGLAITGGFEISLACDILIAGRSARFADTHVRVGINPGWGLSQRLSRAIGISRAKELSLTGNFLSADRAYEWGLVNRVVADDELLGTARELAADIAANDSASVGRMKAVIDEGFAMALGDALAMEAARARTLNTDVSALAVEGRRDAARTRARRAL
jgi:enoyl-CoA hydratase